MSGSRLRRLALRSGAPPIAVTAGVHSRMDTSRAVERRLFVPEPRARAALEPRLRHRRRRLLLAPGAAARRRRTGRHRPARRADRRLIDVVTTLDPWVGHPYRFAAVWLTDSEARCAPPTACSSAASPTHPRDWRNRYHLGFNHFFYLEDEAARGRGLRGGARACEALPHYLGALVAQAAARTPAGSRRPPRS